MNDKPKYEPLRKIDTKQTTHGLVDYLEGKVGVASIVRQKYVFIECINTNCKCNIQHFIVGVPKEQYIGNKCERCGTEMVLAKFNPFL